MDFNRPRRDILFLRILSLLSLQLYIRYTEKIDRFDYDICFNVAFQKITKKEKSENNRGGYHARQIVVPYLRIAILHHSTISSSFYRSLSLSLSTFHPPNGPITFRWDCLRGIVFSVPSSLFSRKTVVSLFAKPVFEKLEITSIWLDDPRINNRLFGDCLFVRDQITFVFVERGLALLRDDRDR